MTPVTTKTIHHFYTVTHEQITAQMNGGKTDFRPKPQSPQPTTTEVPASSDPNRSVHIARLMFAQEQRESLKHALANNQIQMDTGASIHLCNDRDEVTNQTKNGVFFLASSSELGLSFKVPAEAVSRIEGSNGNILWGQGFHRPFCPHIGGHRIVLDETYLATQGKTARDFEYRKGD